MPNNVSATVASPKTTSTVSPAGSSKSAPAEIPTQTMPSAEASLRVDMSALELAARSKPEAHYVKRVLNTDKLAEDIFYGRQPNFLAAAKAQGVDPNEAAASMACQLVMTQQLLETRRVPKATAMLALAKRQDGFSALTMQEAWDAAWEQKGAELAAARAGKEAARKEREDKRAAAVAASKPPNKNGSTKRKEKREAAAATAATAGSNANAADARKQTFMNGGVACTRSTFNLDKKQK